MVRMLRMSLCTGVLLAGLNLTAQEAATISGDQAVRFEQSPGFFHYAAICRTAKEFMAQMPAPRLPLDATEPAVCWYVKGASTSGAGGASPEVDGKLVISAHHVRFMPHGPQSGGLYADLHPEEVELKHEAGQPYATLQSKGSVFTFRFSKLCMTCAPGTPVTPGFVPVLLDQEFGFLDAEIRHFDSGWKQIYRMSSGQRPVPELANQAAVGAALAGLRSSPRMGAATASKAVIARADAAAVQPRIAVPAVSAASNHAGDIAKAVAAPVVRPSVPAEAAPRTPQPAASLRVAPAAPAQASAAPLTRTQPVKPMKIAPNVASGRLLKKVPPAYPLEAKLVRLEGTVLLRAVIEKTGDIAEVYALSGPPLLESAAVDAVKQWEYRPYMINGQPIDVETTIEVVFALDGSHAAPRTQSLK